MNKGRPNTKDLLHAEEFAQRLKQNYKLVSNSIKKRGEE